jgi:hypothetical protein
MPPLVSTVCSQAISRAAALAERRRASAAGSMPASRRQAVGVEATGPKTCAWSRSRARSAVARLHSASITARSTATGPGSRPIPRGHWPDRRVRGRAGQASDIGEIGQQAGSGMADRPATVGRDDKLGTRRGTFTQKVPSCCGDRSPGQVSSSQLRRHFCVSAQDPDAAARSAAAREGFARDSPEDQDTCLLRDRPRVAATRAGA